VQPANRGTAAGILLPALAILERDPGARLAYLPSDHFVEKGHVVENSLRIALESLDDGNDGLTLLGMRPDAPDSGYGWIVPARSARLLPPVERFVEKPQESIAAALMAEGALWNSFLFAVGGAALLRIYEQCLPELARRLREVFALEPGARAARLTALYDELESHDFSRDVLQGEERRLRLERVPPCGWTDLGTPARVAACLAVMRDEPAAPPLAPLELARSSDGRVVLALALGGS
jgi:mannose-1-phosphate guanylyltransferase